MEKRSMVESLEARELFSTTLFSGTIATNPYISGSGTVTYDNGTITATGSVTLLSTGVTYSGTFSTVWKAS